MTISQEITPLPPAPQRTDAPADFITKADAHVASLVGFVDETNIVTSEINDTVDDINVTQDEIDVTQTEIEASATAAAASAASSENSAINAAASANFIGAWVDQVGAANKPYSVSHVGTTWLLENDLVDVTASEPGISSDWFDADSTKRITHNRYLHFYRNR